MAESEIDIIVRAQNLTQAAFQQITGALKSLETQATGSQGTAAKAATGHAAAIEALTAKFGTQQTAVNALTNALSQHAGMNHTAADAVGVYVSKLGVVGGVLAGVATAALAAGAAAVYLADHFMETAHGLEVLSAQSGISVERLSAMSGAAKLVGQDVTGITMASYQMQRRMGEDSAGFSAGLQKIGLSFQQVKNLAPDELLLTVFRRLREITDQSQFMAAGYELMGRGFRESAYLAKEPLDELMDTAKRAGVVLGTEDVEAAHRLEVAFNTLKLTIEGIKLAIGGDLIFALEALTRMGPAEMAKTLAVGSMTGTTGMITTLAESERAFQGGLAATNKRLAERKAQIDALSPSERQMALQQALVTAGLDLQQQATARLDPAVEAWIEHQFNLGRSTEQVVKALQNQNQSAVASADQIARLHDVWKTGADAAKKHQEALDSVAAATRWLTDAERATVAQYMDFDKGTLKAGMSLEQVAEATGIAKERLQAYGDQWKEVARQEGSAQKEAAKALDEWNKETEKLNVKFAAARQDQAQALNEGLQTAFVAAGDMQTKLADQALKGTDLQIAQINREEKAFIASLGVRTVQNATWWDTAATEAQQYYDRERYLATHLVIDWQGVWTSMRASVSNGFAEMLVGARGFKDGFLDIWHGLQSELARIADQILNYFLNMLARQVLGQRAAAAIMGTTMAGGGGGSLNLGGLSGLGASAASSGGGNNVSLLGGSIGPSAASIGTMFAAGSVGAMAGYGVGYGTGNSLAGAAVGAGAGAATGAAVGAIFAPETLGLSIVVGALVGAVAGLYGAYKYHKEQRKLDREADVKIQDRYNELLKTYGGREQLATLGSLVGLGGIENGDQNRKREGLAAFSAEADAFEARIKILQDAIQKYGLTLADMGPAAAASSLKTSAGALLADYQALTTAGADQSTVIDKMSGAFNDLIAQALKSGQKIPAGLQPILDQLVAMGKLTDANRRALLGLGDAVDVDALASIAQKYGISEGALGQGYQQTKTSRSAEQIVADYNTLIKAGADQGGVLTGMKEEIGQVISDALKYGLELPETLRPLVEALSKQGGLPGVDLGKLNWAPDLTSSVDTLTDAINRWIEVIDGLAGNGGPDDGGGPGGNGQNLQDRLPLNLDGRANIPAYAAGGLIAETGLATIHADELIGPVDFMADVLARAMSRGIRAKRSDDGGTAPARTTETISVTFNISTLDPRGFDQIVEQEVKPRIDKILRRGGEERTRTRQAMGLSPSGSGV